MGKASGCGPSADGTRITDEVIERVVAEAEAGYDVDELLERRRGRPLMGSLAADAWPVRMDPELRASVVERAEREGIPQGEVVRRALRQYLTSRSVWHDQATASTDDDRG